MKSESQNWKKKGLLFKPENNFNWMKSHASVPLISSIKNDFATIIFSVRNSKSQSLPASLRLNLDTLMVESVAETPLLQPGKAGSFDEDGIMPVSLVKSGNNFLLYYIGWNLAKSVPFRNSIGLAISYDNCQSFSKMYPGPVIDRNIYDPYFVASCDVIYDNGSYKMWYLSCVDWQQLSDGTSRHHYHIKYTESEDGVNWKRSDKIAIGFKYSNEYAISVPRVIKESGKYKMWYSYRGGLLSETYRIGYAESDNGVDWVRMDELINLNTSASGWDSEMICYPFVFDYKGRRYLLYNGNGYGKTGFGMAVLNK